jgi:hypothetical protein
MAASTTERASRFGSVGFFFSFLLGVGFGMPHDARAVRLLLVHQDSNFTSTNESAFFLFS